MSDDLIKRMEAACVGHPHAKIPWPHRLLHEAAARIRELEAAQGVAVKPLEWVDDRAGLWGNGLFAYIIRPGGEGYYWFRRNGTHTNILPDKPGIEATKAAAQADYERRIRSALTPAPVTVEEAAQIVWDDCLQKASPEAARQRKKAINAIMKLKIPSIPMAQRWAIVNVALRALAGQGGE